MSEQHLTAVVAGVGPGLGAAVCRRLTAAGYAVAGLARSTKFGQQLANELVSAGREMAFFVCAVTDPRSGDRPSPDFSPGGPGD